MAYQLEIGAAVQMRYVAFAPGEKVVQADDVVAVFEQAIAEVGTQKSGTAGNKNTHDGTDSMRGPDAKSKPKSTRRGRLHL
jgi:hypothetical protein